MTNIPKTLSEAANLLLETADPSSHEIFNNLSMEEFSATLHSITGRWIRNNWMLWEAHQSTEFMEGYELYHDLLDKGLMHPDDMSTVIIEQTWCLFHNKEYDINKRVIQFLDHWSKVADESNNLRQSKLS